MVQQIWIMITLYVLGIAFIVLFYPKIPFSLCVTSALFWGALIYIFSAVILAFFGLYTRFIFVLMSAEVVIFIIMNLKRRTIWKTISWKKAGAFGIILACIFGFVLVVTNNEHIFLMTPDSIQYVIQGSHIFNLGSIITLGSGRFYRSYYGVSEALMHSLARFESQPMLTLWHPYLWITLYSSFFVLLYEFSQQKKMSKSTSITLGLLMTLWVGTAGLNWLNGYYIHTHLFTSVSIFFTFYFFGKMAASEQEETEYGFLGALALCGFGLSRAESPILIGLFLALLLGAKHFTRKEIYAAFLPPILIEFVWLAFLLFAYFGSETDFWTDNRIILMLGTYILFTLFVIIVVLNEKLQAHAKKHLTNTVFIILLTVSLLLFIIKPNHQIRNLNAIFSHLFSLEVWGYYWWENLVILILVIFYKKYWQKKNSFSQSMMIVGVMIGTYLLIILDLSFFRSCYYMMWYDSASRMLSHISPITGFCICKSTCDYFALTTRLRKEGLHK